MLGHMTWQNSRIIVSVSSVKNPLKVSSKHSKKKSFYEVIK